MAFVSELFEWIQVTVGLDEFAIIQIFTLSAVCGFICAQLLDSWLTSVVCNVGLLFSALTANIVMRRHGVAFTFNKDLDGIIFSAAGLIAGAITVVILKLLFSWLNNRLGLSAQQMRERDMAQTAARDFTF